MKKLILFVYSIFMLYSVTAQSVVTFPLNITDPGGCNISFYENGSEFQFVSTGTEDSCPGNCSYGITSGAVWLWQGRLQLSLAAFPIIDKIEVDIEDYCGVACTRAYVYETPTSVYLEQNILTGPGTLIIDPPNPFTAPYLYISSCEGAVNEIRIYSLSGGCTLSLSTQITDASSVSSADGAIDLSVTGGTTPYSYSWSNGSTNQDQTNLPPGSYSVTVSDSGNCTASTSAQVGVSNPLAIDGVITYSQTNNCSGSIDITVIGGQTPYIYLWNNGETSEDLTNLCPGTYGISVTDGQGFIVDSFFDVFYELSIDGTVTNSASTACTGAIDITVNGGQTPYTYLWSNGETTEDIVGLCPGSYSVTVTDNLNYNVDSFFDVFVEVPTNGACCLPNGNCTNTDQSTCQSMGGIFNGIGTSCSSTTCGPITNQFSLATDIQGTPVNGGGNGQFDDPLYPSGYNGWYFYPQTNWWNIWFYDHPLDTSKYKVISIEFDLDYLFPGLPAYLNFAVNWSTPQWDPPAVNAPPLPSLVGTNESQYIQRPTLMEWTSTLTVGHQVFSYIIPDYCPEWVSIDVQGYNFNITNGIITHECMTNNPPTGACCMPDGSCSEVDSVTCLQSGGSYYGDNTSCANIVCDTIGKCCYPDTTGLFQNLCTNTTHAQCDLLLGTWNPNAVCTSDTCGVPVQIGACCMPDGSCIPFDSITCVSGGGIYQGDGSACTSVVCEPIGRCCYPIVGTNTIGCSEIILSQCNQLQGTWDPNLTCNDPCVVVPPTGACCMPDGSCSEIDSVSCLQSGGSYFGDNTSCANVVCDTIGKCCYPDTTGLFQNLCTNTTHAQCDLLLGTWNPNAVCTSDTCGVPVQIGACCMPDGSCIPFDSITCVSGGGIYQGDGSACTSVVCEPIGRCCYPILGTNSIGCSEITLSQCNQLQGTWDPNLTCNDPCVVVPPTGACCMPDGSCSEVDSVSCLQSGGTYYGDNTSCANVVCDTIGKCCYPDTTGLFQNLCTNTTHAQCDLLLGTWNPNAVCTSDTCGVPVQLGACCMPDGSCTQLDSVSCLQSGGTFQGVNSDCFTVNCPNMCPTFNNFSAGLTMNGAVLANPTYTGGSDYYNQGTNLLGWYYYPSGWWNMWFCNLPYNPNAYKEIYINFDIELMQAGLPYYLELAINWSKPAWDNINTTTPPIPSLVAGVPDSIYIQRHMVVMTDSPNDLGHYEYCVVIPEYCPAWVSIDINGSNVRIYNGTIDHQCYSGTPPIGRCCYQNAFGASECIDTYECDCSLLNGTWDPTLSCITDPCIISNPTGACCMPDGSCSEIDSVSCLQSGGSYYGDNTSCANVVCDTIGKCCYPDTTGLFQNLCTNTTHAQCDLLLGTWNPNAVCTSDTCGVPVQIGACCMPDGSCIPFDSITCVSGGGIYQGDGSACTSVVCEPIGRCCYPILGTNTIGCSEITLSQCNQLQGTWDPNLTCNDPCVVVPPTGACCMPDGSCSEIDSVSCLQSGGSYYGDNTSCANVVCDTIGKCCYPDPTGLFQNLCTNTTHAQCDLLLGTWDPNAVCASDTCGPVPIMGACCLSDSCFETSETNCDALGGLYMGDGTTCANNPCPVTNLFWITVDVPGTIITNPLMTGGLGQYQTGVNGWVLYPSNWMNIWFYDHPFDSTRYKKIHVTFTLVAYNPQLPVDFTMAINWSTPEWSNSLLNNGTPPLPFNTPTPAEEEMYIERPTLVDYNGILASASYFDFNIIIPAYNPEWVSIDVMGSNFYIDNGTIWHACLPGPPPLTVNLGPDVSICQGDCINLTATGANTYQWSTGETTSAISSTIIVCPSATSTYSVTATDLAGNISFDDITVTVNNPPTLSLDCVDPFCFGTADGEITANVTNSSGGSYTYQWSNGATGNYINSLNNGTYSVTVTDANGCAASASCTLNDPNPLMISIGIGNVSCNNGNDGALMATVSGGTSPYSYWWSNGQTTPTINSLSAGVYTLSIYDQNGCSAVTTALVTEPPPIVVQTVSINMVSCYGGNDGSITVMPSGGTSPYSYLWSNGAINSSISGLVAGSYNLTVTDANNCTVLQTFSITEPSDLTLSITASDISCHGAHDGTISVSSSGGQSPYSYYWLSGATATSFSNMGPGTYSVTVTDYNGCTESGSATINEPNELILQLVINEISCYGSNDGGGHVTVTSGSPPYSYLWNNGGTNSYVSNYGPGLISVTVTDANSCTHSASSILTEPPELNESVTSTNPTCQGSSDGSIALSVSGGTTPYSYSWSTGATSSSLNGLPAGNYSYTITDANSCQKSGTVTLSSPTVLSISLTTTNVSCYGGSDGSITVTPVGGTSPYSYLWSNGATNNSISGLVAGSYSLTVTDANNCALLQTISITEPFDLTLSITVSDISCHGAHDGTISVSASGGQSPYSYIWVSGATASSFSNLGPGTYSVTVTDANSCTNSASYVLTEPPELIESVTSNNPSCQGSSDGSIALSVSGGTTPYSYSWSTGATTSSLSGLPAGNYSYTITDANSCQKSGTVTLSNPTALSISLTTTNVSCYGGNDGSINSSVTGGTPPYSYLWSTSETTTGINNLYAGSYQLTVSDANNCTALAGATISQPLQLIISETHGDPSSGSASDGYISLTVSGGTSPYTYQWSNGATTSMLNGLPVGTYCVTVNDANGCQEDLCIDLIGYNCPNMNGFYIELDANGNPLTTQTGGSDFYPGGTSGWFNYLSGWWNIWFCNLPWDSTAYKVVTVDFDLLATSPNTYIEFAVNWTTPAWDSVHTNMPPLPNSSGVSQYENVYISRNILLQSDDQAIMAGHHQYSFTIQDNCPGWVSIDVQGFGFKITNGVIQHDCITEVFGQCCYIENGDVQCAYITESECNQLNGSWNSTLTCLDDCILPPPWNDVVNTGNNHSIFISDTINLTIDGLPISNGDALGVFYLDNGVEYCGGVHIWTGIPTVLAAWGDDNQTSVKDGFASNEEFNWKIWDASTGTEYNATPSYNSSFPNQGNYVNNGMSALASLTAVSCQVISLNSGWSMISTYISPFAPSMDSIFADIVSQVSIVKDESGLVYWPSVGVNMIGSWSDGEGYQIKMLSAQTLTICGSLLNPSATGVYLPSGWSLFGYLCQSPHAISTELSAFVSDILIVKNGLGLVYWPMVSVDQIGNMNPGEGYQIKMSAAHTLYYDCSSSGSTKNFVVPQSPQHFKVRMPTDQNMTLGIPQSCLDSYMKPGDEIGVFTEEGQLVSAAVYERGFTVLTLWGDDSMTEPNDGLKSMEQYQLRIFHKESGKEELIVVTHWSQGNGEYDKNAIDIAAEIDFTGLDGRNAFLFQNIPNPFKNSSLIQFYIPARQTINLSLYDVHGRKIRELVTGNLGSGLHSVEVNTHDLPPGTYFYSLEINGERQTKSMAIIR